MSQNMELKLCQEKFSDNGDDHGSKASNEINNSQIERPIRNENFPMCFCKKN